MRFKTPPSSPHHVVSYAINSHSYKDFELGTYGLFWKMSSNCAIARGRELAEGPTLLVKDSYYGDLEVWPLVQIGGE